VRCLVLLSAEAEEQLRRVDSWWQLNRRAAPDLEEFEGAIGILEEMPEVGSRFQRATLPGVRRILLRRTGYWIYYVPDTSRSLVYVLAVWSAQRGSDPPIAPRA
jgi:plasmid stabilization system protein ParE